MLNLETMRKRVLSREPVVIIGGGLAGSAMAYHLARLAKKYHLKREIILLEQFDLLHALGSSGGETRLTRFANAESVDLTDTAIATANILRDMQADMDSGKDRKIASALRASFGHHTLLQRNGTLVMGMKGDFAREAHGVRGFVQTTIRYARERGIRHDELDGHEIAKHFPGMPVPREQRDHTEGYYEHDSGTLFIQNIVAAQLMMAQRDGVRVIANSRALALRDRGLGSAVLLADGSLIEASKIVICAGPWTSMFYSGGYADQYKTERQVPVWFKNRHPKRFSVKSHPNFIRFFPTRNGDVDYFYGIAGTSRGVKVAQEARIGVPMGVAGLGQVFENEICSLFNKVSPYVWDISLEGAQGEVCHYTTTPDHNFRIGPHPERLNVIGFSACSGHGAKNIPALAEALAHHVLELKEKPKIDLRKFGWHDDGPGRGDMAVLGALKI